MNHPHIASIYGLEHSDSTRFLVLEFVAGEDLAERLLRGLIPISETIEICRQISEALEEAHENGVVHRDLKPANIKVDPDGKVKVLDRSPSQEMMAVPIEFDSAGVIIPGTPRRLFNLSGILAWDITDDHERILIARDNHDLAAVPMFVSVNWVENFSARQSSFD